MEYEAATVNLSPLCVEAKGGIFYTKQRLASKILTYFKLEALLSARVLHAVSVQIGT